MSRQKVTAGLLFLVGLLILLLGTLAVGSLPPPSSPTAVAHGTGQSPTPAGPPSYPGPPRPASPQAFETQPRNTGRPTPTRARPTATLPPERPPTRVSPAPTPTWPIVVPPLVTPGPTADAYRGLPFGATPRPTVTLAPERHQAFVAALGALPEFPPLLKAQNTVARVEVQTLELLSLDVDGDPPDETLWFYLIRPIYDPPEDYPYVHGYSGAALFDDDDRLLWCSEPQNVQDKTGDLGFLAVEAEPVVFAPGAVGVLSRRYEECLCNGAYRSQLTTLYHWDGTDLQVVWQRTTAGGGKMGAGLGSSMWENVALDDIDGAGWPELLLQRADAVANSDDWQRRRHYTLYLPGAIAFGWDGEAYVPGYFVDGSRTVPIRRRLPVYYAPRLSVPPTIDGRDEEWWQIEYRQDLLLHPNDGAPFPYLTVGWDEQYLYLTWPRMGQPAFFFALDTDLAGDLDEDTLNEDDFAWKVEVSRQAACTATLDVCAPHGWEEFAGHYQIAASPKDYGCTMELALPLSWLGLSGQDLVPEIGWVGGSPDPHEWREYHPRAGRVVGFMVNTEEFPAEAGNRLSDPTTWTTLVFMADR